MARQSSALIVDSITENYDQLVLCASALQLSLSAGEQVDFLTDAIDACDRITALFEGVEIANGLGPST